MQLFPPQIENIFQIQHHAVIFGIFARSLLEHLDLKNRSFILDIVRQYGHERGHRMAQRAQFFGDELTMENFLIYGEWIPEPEHMDQRIVAELPTYISQVTRCPWCSTWTARDWLDVGQLYCQSIDLALVEGFNPDLVLKINGNLTSGKNSCEFHWMGLEMTEETKKRMEHKRIQLQMLVKKSWEYHCAHLYWTFRHAVELSHIKSTGSISIIDDIDEKIALEFSPRHLQLLQQYTNTDFTKIFDFSTKYFMIGFGNLLESLFPYFALHEYRPSPPNLHNIMQATTADQEKLVEKQKKFDIPIFFKENLSHLQNFQPEVILFAPPPSEVPHLLETVFIPYFLWCDAQKLPRPVIYAFPAAPPIEEYSRILGAVAQIVTILPNDVRSIDQRPVRGEGHHLCTFSSHWSMYVYEHLASIVSQFGHILALTSENVLGLLIPRVLTTALLHVFVRLVNDFTRTEVPADAHNIATQWKDGFTEIILKTSEFCELPNLIANFSPFFEESHNSSILDIPDILLYAWYDGIIKFIQSYSLSWNTVQGVIQSMFRLIIRQCAEEKFTNIVHHIQTAATKGGLLEKTIDLINHNLFSIPLSHWTFQELSSMVESIAGQIFKHGQNLLKKK